MFASLCIIFSSFVSTSATDSSLSQAVSQHPGLTEAEISAMSQAKALKAYFVIRQVFTLDDNGEIIAHPDGYGGCYINDNNELVIRIAEGNPNLKDRISRIADANGVTVVFEDCAISINDAYKQLQDFVELVGCSSFDNTYYSVYDNAYIIDVTAENAQKLEKLLTNSRAISSFPNISLNIISSTASPAPSSTSRITTATTPISPLELCGGMSLLSSDNSAGTLGICGTYNDTPCILTAGHVAKNRTLRIPSEDTSSTYINAPGDSGGPVWIIDESGSRVFLGTVSGGSGQSSSIYYEKMYVSSIMFVSDPSLPNTKKFVPCDMTAVEY